MRRFVLGPHPVFGYACVPRRPSCSRLGAVRRVAVRGPRLRLTEDGYRSVPVPEARRGGHDRRRPRGARRREDVSGSVFLFHAPPHGTALDRAALDGKAVDHAPLDVHVGASRSAGSSRRGSRSRPSRARARVGAAHRAWRERIGRTVCLSAAHDARAGLVRLDLDEPGQQPRTPVGRCVAPPGWGRLRLRRGDPASRRSPHQEKGALMGWIVTLVVGGSSAGWPAW